MSLFDGGPGRREITLWQYKLQPGSDPPVPNQGSRVAGNSLSFGHPPDFLEPIIAALGRLMISSN